MKEKFPNNIIVSFIKNIAIAGVVFLFLTGCRSNRAITSEADPENSLSNHEMILLLEQKSEKIETLKIRRADLEIVLNGMQNTAKGNLAIYRDSIIAVSIIPALGFEALRILCTRDSVIVINRMEKSYYASSFEHYKKKYNIPVGFNEIQAIFSNEMFYYKGDYDDREFEKQFRKKNDKNLFIVDAFHDGRRLTNQLFGLDDGGLLLENMFITDFETRMRLFLEYEDFAHGEPIVFPQKISMDISGGQNKIQLKIHSNQIIFNEAINVEFAVPSHYIKEEL